MGCSPSRVNPQGNEAMTPRPMPADKRANGHVKNGQMKKTKTDSNANQSDINTNNPGKSFMFSVEINNDFIYNNYENFKITCIYLYCK